MNKEQIKKKVSDSIVELLGVEKEEVVDEASFINDLGADSLDLAELIMNFESEFTISIPDDEAESIQTVGDAINAIDKKLND